MASDLTADGAQRTRKPARRPIRIWMVLLALGVASIIAGGALIGRAADRRVPARRRRFDSAQALEGRHRQARGGPGSGRIHATCPAAPAQRPTTRS